MEREEGLEEGGVRVGPRTGENQREILAGAKRADLCRYRQVYFHRDICGVLAS